MKRSEVLNLISNMFYECNVEPDFAEAKAEWLLAELERLGIRPPTRSFETIEGQVYVPGLYWDAEGGADET